MGEGGTEGALGDRLRSAVGAGDAKAVRGLLEKGADPDTVDADGLPVLCAAVAAYDGPVAEALVEGGADPDRELPDGTTPLWRAVDGGSPVVFSAVLGKEPRLRLPEDARRRLLDLARGWYETGAAEELRRRTGATGPAATVRVQDDTYDWVHQVALGGLVVRAGHGAVLSCLEWAFRVLTPVDELVARAVGQRDADHVDWSVNCWVLAQRRSVETWSAVVAHRHAPDVARRRFVAEYVQMRGLFDSIDRDLSHTERERELLTSWAVEETDGQTLAKVLDLYLQHDPPDQEALGLRYVGHPDPLVRREVPYALSGDPVPRTPAARAAMLTLLRDPDDEVRLAVCLVSMRDDGLRPEITRTLLALLDAPDAGVRAGAADVLATSGDHSPAVADALAELLGDDDQFVRLMAAHGLVLRDDPRTGEAIERVGPLSEEFEYDTRADALRAWTRRNRTRTETAHE